MTFRVSVMVSGRGSNLEALLNFKPKNYEVAHVLTDVPDCPAAKLAAERSIPVSDVSLGNNRDGWAEMLCSKAAGSKPDLIVLAGFMKLLPEKFVTQFHGKLINIHPSLLPSFKGLHAQKQAFEAGSKISGCTVHFVEPECDSGPVIAQAAVSISGLRSSKKVSGEILKLEHKLLPSVVSLIAAGQIMLEADGSVKISSARNETPIFSYNV